VHLFGFIIRKLSVCSRICRFEWKKHTDVI